MIGCITDGKRPHEYEEELSEYKLLISLFENMDSMKHDLL